MSLLTTSDDALSLILGYLYGDNLCFLRMTGSRRLIERLELLTEHFFWSFSTPSLFPSSCYDFPKLKSLTIQCSTTSEGYGHLSLLGRTIHPLKPMASLTSLDLDYPLSPVIFEPLKGSLPLSSCFPSLTSLSIRAITQTSDRCWPLCSGWAKTLPDSLLSLKVDASSNEISISTFYSLPQGLQEIELGDSCPVDSSALDLTRFRSLRVLRLLLVSSWNFLSSLPDSIEELTIDAMYTALLPAYTLCLSSLPPKIRVLSLSGRGFTINFNCMAPSTLEEVHLEDFDFLPQYLEQSFPSRNLRKLSMRNIKSISPTIWQQLPNLEYLSPYQSIVEFEELEMLPRNLKSLWLQKLFEKRTKPLENLPPSLKELKCSIVYPEDLSKMPSKLTSLVIEPFDDDTLAISADDWKALSCRHLKILDVDLALFASETCMMELPGSLEQLTLSITIPESCLELCESLCFPKALQESLKTLFILCSHSELILVDTYVPKLIPKLSSFSQLSMLHISSQILISSDSLSNLPKSLTDLYLDDVFLENHGLPAAQDRVNSDWKDGAFSKLPEGLLKLSITVASTMVDLMAFSRLPSRLTFFCVMANTVFDFQPDQFIASLPRRISFLQVLFDKQESENKYSEVSDEEEEEYRDEEDELTTALQKAIQEYYSDDFWYGTVPAACGNSNYL